MFIVAGQVDPHQTQGYVRSICLKVLRFIRWTLLSKMGLFVAGFHMTPKLSRIFPESCLLIAVGVFIGVLLTHTGNMNVSPLTPDTFFLYMLPPIILDAGYFMPNRLFFDHLGTILLFAVVGTIFNTLTIGK